MTLHLAIDSNAVRLWELANDGRWDDAKQASGPEQSLAMLRLFLYGDVLFLIAPAVRQELRSHGNPEVAADSVKLLDVLFEELGHQSSLDDFIATWAGRGASAKDAVWLGEVVLSGRADGIVTFDTKLIRGIGGQIEGIPVRTPVEQWIELDIQPSANLRALPGFGHPLLAIDDWRLD
ncbi:MAG: hypothetical protein H0U53_03290 [Actinobacteria bacterium]|nr:hypothetical protein [Actinomycetota bacterium]